MAIKAKNTISLKEPAMRKLSCARNQHRENVG